MRRTLTLIGLTGALLVPALPALAAGGAPVRAGLDTTSQNGGDQGFGNCGRNSSSGQHNPLAGSAGNGNGGHKKGETCTVVVSAPAGGDKTAPVTGGGAFDDGRGAPVMVAD